MSEVNYEEVDLSTYSVEELREKLEEEKIRMSIANTDQLNRKILINSLYGALGSEYFRFYSVDNAEAVTSFGQLAIKWVESAMNIYLNKVNKTENVDYICYIDTDSIYVDFDKFMSIANVKTKHEGEKLVDYMSMLCEKITESVINTCYQKLQVYMNNVDNHMNMDREVISIDGGFFTAKKRYALSVNDNEGVRYEVPKLKLIGIETQRSSTPKAVTTALTDSISAIIMKGESDLQNVVSKFEDGFSELDISMICGTSTANNIFVHGDEDIKPKRGCPGHIKGALAYNRYIKNKNLSVEPINDGEKINIVTLKIPNPYGEKVFAWPAGSEIDLSFGDVTEYIDYNVLFQDKFMKPLNGICDSLSNMSPIKKRTLSSFFGT